MSNLSKNTTDLQAILAAVNALPEAGSGGGASVETCTVTISVETTNAQYIACVAVYTTFENGIMSVTYTTPSISNATTPQVTLQNVVRNSMLAVYTVLGGQNSVSAVNATLVIGSTPVNSIVRFWEVGTEGTDVSIHIVN